MAQAKQFWDEDIEMVRWKCPECGASKSGALRKCTCGFVRSI